MWRRKQHARAFAAAFCCINPPTDTTPPTHQPTGPCQHNYCLACFTRWTQQRKTSCPTCRAAFPARFADTARVNTALAMAIRMARLGQKAPPKSFVVSLRKGKGGGLCLA